MKLKITFLLLFIGCLTSAQTIAIPVFATGFTSPVEIVNAGDSRLFVVQQGGAIRVLNADGSINATNFINLSGVISTGGERGLLGLAFHPNYAVNGYFYVNYTRASDGATVIARYTVSDANTEVADPASAVILMTIAQPFSNHNGGTIKFGPDGYLYIGMGDGGSGGDPGDRAQNINENLGKMLRIDVNSGSPYGIPVNNPFVGVAGNDEIWAVGLRNPWKFSFNETSGELWIADVGQNQIEEINVVNAATPGLNYGWRCYEGNTVFTSCSSTGPFTFPFATYSHTGGACSITGGYSYTGTTYPNFFNKYFFADYCVNRIGMVNETTGAITYSVTFPGSNNFTTFGRDINGELYVAGSSSGTVYKIIDTSLTTADFDRPAITLSPNPAAGEVLVKSSAFAYPCTVSLFDLAGKLLIQTALTSETQNINVSSLSSGIYMLSVSDDTGKRTTSKLAIK